MIAALIILGAWLPCSALSYFIVRRSFRKDGLGWRAADRRWAIRAAWSGPCALIGTLVEYLWSGHLRRRRRK